MDRLLIHTKLDFYIKQRIIRSSFLENYKFVVLQAIILFDEN